MGLIETAARRVLSEELTDLQNKTRQYDQGMELLLERFAALELALEDSGWRRLSAEGEREFSRKGLQQIIALSRLMYLSNPLINRAVDLQSLYVWGQGVTMSSEDEATADLISQTTTHRQNKVELFGHQGRKLKEIELQVTGNVFLALFRNISNGTLEISSIPVEEIDEIIRDPENRAQVWYYKRVWTAQEFDQSGRLIGTHKTAYYPDWTYQPQAKPKTIGRDPVMWETPIYHIKVGGFSDMAFGVPETYAAIDWARAYKEFLEDWASIVRAHKRFAWQMKVGGGKAGIAAAKNKLNTTLGTDSYETNPAPTVGSTYIASGENKIEPIKTAGATVSAEDGRRLLLMVCAATGIPESFFGDVSLGTLATAKSLDRPTELKYRDRQLLWTEVYQDLLAYARDAKTRAPNSGLVIETDATIDVEFPPVIQGDIEAQLKAIVSAATLDGKPLAGTMDIRTAARLVLTALGQDDIEELISNLPEPGEPGGEVSDDEMVEALRNLNEAVKGLAAD